jgi:hypothetical protein
MANNESPHSQRENGDGGRHFQVPPGEVIAHCQIQEFIPVDAVIAVGVEVDQQLHQRQEKEQEYIQVKKSAYG